MKRERYEALDIDGKLRAKLHDLHHLGRYAMDSRGGQRRILQVLSERGTMTQRELTEQLGIQPGSASEVIGKLERAGLIERSENAGDRRTVDVRLTAEGRERARDGSRDRADLFRSLDKEEKEVLLTLLEKLSADWESRFGRDRHHREEEHRRS